MGTTRSIPVADEVDVVTLLHHLLEASLPITTLSSREFNQDAGNAKKAAKKGPVIITDRGRPAHVLLSFEDYRKLTAKRESIGDLLSNPESADFEFDPPRIQNLLEDVDLS